MDIFQLILAIILSIIQIPTTFYQIKDKVHYPIKQLSPIITINQGVFLIQSQILLIIQLFLQTDRNDKECYEIEEQNIITKGLITLLYIFSRGCCFSFAFIKTYRIVMSFRKTELNPRSALVKYLKDEKLLLLIGYFYSFVGFPLLSYFTTIFWIQDYNHISCWLENYHNNRSYIMVNSLIEEIVCVILMFFLIIYHLEDNLYKLTLNPLTIYMLWFIFLSLIIKIKLNIINEIIGLLFWIRAVTMFYLYIIRPQKQVQMYPTLYLDANKIRYFDDISSIQFQGHFKNSIILLQFNEYLIHLNQNHDKRQQLFSHQDVKQEFRDIKQDKLYGIYLKLQNLIDQTAPFGDITNYLMSQFNQEALINLAQQPEKMQSELAQHLRYIYQTQFQITIAFQTINDYYGTQKIAVKNLDILGMTLSNYDPTL